MLLTAYAAEIVSALTRTMMSDKKARPSTLKRVSYTSSGALLGSPRKERIILETTQDDNMAAFLQYCAMCEKQIMTPSSSILYCSEACHNKDNRKPLSAANLTTTMSSLTPPSPRILQPRTPTGADPTTDIPVVRIPVDINHFKSDLDPTECASNMRIGRAFLLT